MITIGANGQKIAYGIKHYNLDSENDLANLPKDRDIMGATAFVISTSKYYMLNSNLQWVEIKPFGASNSSPSPEYEEIIWEGGVI